MKPVILFVDDEAKILQGLKRSLRPLRNEWDVDFAVGGAEALAKLAARPADVVVSDMRMPGMDGATLLDRVLAEHPATVRFVLSGQCDEDIVYRLTGNSHRFFSKPCDAERLIAAIREVLVRRARVAAEPARRAATQAALLPGDPEVRNALRAALAAGEPPLSEVTGIVARDPGLTAKMLQLAGSAYFGTGSPVSSLGQAVQRLGAESLRRLILRDGLPAPAARDSAVPEFWRRSRACAGLARQIAEGEGLAAEAAAAAHLAGLLHRTGDLVLAADPAAAAAVEGADQRAALGAYLLALWGLPAAIVEAVAFHHAPNHAPGRAPDPANRVLAVVHAAAHLVAREGAPDDGAGLDLQFLDGQGLGPRLPAWTEAATRIAEGGMAHD